MKAGKKAICFIAAGLILYGAPGFVPLSVQAQEVSENPSYEGQQAENDQSEKELTQNEQMAENPVQQKGEGQTGGDASAVEEEEVLTEIQRAYEGNVLSAQNENAGAEMGQLKQVMENIGQKEVGYRLSASENGQEDTDWQECRIAGIFTSTEDDGAENGKSTEKTAASADQILISYEQAWELMSGGSDREIHKILLTVKGEEQMEEARAFFSQ